MSRFVIAALFFSSLACASSGGAQGFRSSPDWQKLDLRFQTAWEDAASGGNREQPFQCMIKTVAVPTAAEKKKLAEGGFRARAFAGTIVTGEVKREEVATVAALPFVKVMELAVPLSTK